jgi:hypothetical protein
VIWEFRDQLTALVVSYTEEKRKLLPKLQGMPVGVALVPVWSSATGCVVRALGAGAFVSLHLRKQDLAGASETTRLLAF